MRWRTAHARRRRRQCLVIQVDERAFGHWLDQLLADEPFAIGPIALKVAVGIADRHRKPPQ